jgi:phage terminase large subunit GpA-like protein
MRTSRAVRLRTSPWWLPEKFRKRAERIRISFRPFAGERQLYRRKKEMPPSAWAEKYRVVTYGPLKGSRWSNSFMPHLRGILDASFFPSVRYIGNCKVAQTGSSAMAETALGYIADMQPGPAFVCYPDRPTAAKRSTDYMQPMFTDSPVLRRQLTGADDDMASLRVKLKTMLIYMGWAGSVTSLGNITARYLIGDEVDKWPDQATKKEASTIKLFLERFRAFKYGGKCWLISTPSVKTGAIWVYMTQEAQVVFDYHAKCPDCGELREMSIDHVRWPEDVRDPVQVEQQDLARYVCPACGSEWDDRRRKKALDGGVWFARGDGRELFEYLRQMRPRKICFHSPAWVSPLVTNSEMAAAVLKGDLHFLDNQIKAIAHVPQRQARKEDAIYTLADDRPEMLVPGGGKVAALLGQADTQDNGFYFTIRAFGWGLEQESWLIRFGFTMSFEELAHIMFGEQYRDAQGLYYPVHMLVIDSGGHRTSEVYDFSRRFPGRVQCYKGARGRRPNPITWTTIDRYPGTKIPIPGGVRLAIADSHHYKDQLATKLKIKEDLPGAWHFHQGVNEKDVHGRDFAAQMCAESVDERNLWECPEGVANHFWDCEVMGLVGADILQIKYWPKEGGA